MPPNVSVIGTMNTADRSIALLDTALRRRFGFIELMPEPELLGDVIVDGVPLGPWLEALNARSSWRGADGRNLQVGHAYLLERGTGRDAGGSCADRARRHRAAAPGVLLRGLPHAGRDPRHGVRRCGVTAGARRALLRGDREP